MIRSGPAQPSCPAGVVEQHQPAAGHRPASSTSTVAAIAVANGARVRARDTSSKLSSGQTAHNSARCSPSPSTRAANAAAGPAGSPDSARPRSVARHRLIRRDLDAHCPHRLSVRRRRPRSRNAPGQSRPDRYSRPRGADDRPRRPVPLRSADMAGICGPTGSRTALLTVAPRRPGSRGPSAVRTVPGWWHADRADRWISDGVSRCHLGGMRLGGCRSCESIEGATAPPAPLADAPFLRAGRRQAVPLHAGLVHAPGRAVAAGVPRRPRRATPCWRHALRPT